MASIDVKTLPISIRRLIILIEVVVIIALYIGRVSGLPYLRAQEIINDTGLGSYGNILDNLISSAVTALVITLVSAWLFPLKPDKVSLQEVPSNEIDDSHAEALKDTKIWWYMGPVGKYFRANDLPRLVDLAKQNKGIELNLLILDPNEEKPHQVYNRIREQRGQTRETIHEVRLNLLVTILTLLLAKSHSPRLKVRIGLLNRCPIFRYDLSSRMVLVTTEGIKKKDFAIRSDEGTFFYGEYLDDLDMNMETSRIILNFNDKIKLESSGDKISLADVHKILSQLDIHHDDITDDDLRQVIREVQSNPAFQKHILPIK